MRVATARINYRGKENELVLDTTYKSGKGLGVYLAPTKKLVWASKNGEISWQTYTERYWAMMRKSYEKNPEVFQQLLNSDKTVVFVCYCPDTSGHEKHCHRYILVEIFRTFAEKRGKEFSYLGELK